MQWGDMTPGFSWMLRLKGDARGDEEQLVMAVLVSSEDVNHM
jgi:hypothetical protein